MSNRTISIILRLYNRIIEFAALLAGIMIIGLMLIVTMEVVLRYFFSSPTSWVTEVSGYALVFIPFLVAPWVLRREGHVSMDLLINRLSPKTKSVLNAVTSFISALICLGLSWFGLKVTLYFFKLSYKTPTVLMLPKFILISIIFIGSFLLGIQFFIRAYNHMTSWKKLRSTGE